MTQERSRYLPAVVGDHDRKLRDALAKVDVGTVALQVLPLLGNVRSITDDSAILTLEAGEPPLSGALPTFVVVLPGGLEALAVISAILANRAPVEANARVILYGRSYWTGFLAWLREMNGHQTLARVDIADTFDDIVSIIRA